MNRLRRGNSARISFFSFQDIITSVTGILILVTLMLSFSLKTGDPEMTEDERMAAEARRERERLAQIEQENRRIQERRLEAANLPDSTHIQSQVAALRRQSSQLEQQRRQSETALEALQGRVQKLPETPSKLREEIAALEEKTKDLEQKLARARTNSNLVYVVPDAEIERAKKTPLALVVNADSIRMFRINGGELQQLPIANADSIDLLLERLDLRKDLLVFYFRPSGVKWFEAFRNKARAAGFEIGYDAVEEQKELVFAAP